MDLTFATATSSNDLKKTPKDQHLFLRKKVSHISHRNLNIKSKWDWMTNKIRTDEIEFLP